MTRPPSGGRQGGPEEGWGVGGSPATRLLGQGSICPWATPAKQGPPFGFPDYSGPETQPVAPSPLPSRAPAQLWPLPGDPCRTCPLMGCPEDSTAEPSPLPWVQAGAVLMLARPPFRLSLILFSRGGSWGLSLEYLQCLAGAGWRRKSVCTCVHVGVPPCPAGWGSD